MLQADSVTHAYGERPKRGDAAPLRQADETRAGVHGVTLQVAAGRLIGIIGPNGSGKTTLLRLLGGLARPSSGRVLLDGRDLRSVSRRGLARRISVVPQETRLAFDFTVQEIVLMGRFPHLGPFEMEGRDDVEIAREALRSTGTLDLAGRPFATLSGGEKQRAIIAGALAQAADLMLLDEPTAALDPGYQLEIAALLRGLNAERGVTMAVATHDLNLAAGLCTSLVLLREGRVSFQGRWYRAETELRPPASRPGGPPILIAGKLPRMLRLVARHADLWNAAWYGPPAEADELGARIERLMAACSAVGRDPARLTLTAGVFVHFPELAREGDEEPPATAMRGTTAEVGALIAGYRDRGIAEVIVHLWPRRPDAVRLLAEAATVARAAGASATAV